MHSGAAGALDQVLVDHDAARQPRCATKFSKLRALCWTYCMQLATLPRNMIDRFLVYSRYTEAGLLTQLLRNEIPFGIIPQSYCVKLNCGRAQLPSASRPRTFAKRAKKVGNHDASENSLATGTCTLFFFRWDISVICSITALKLAVTIHGLPFQILRPNWLHFFRSFKKEIRSITEKQTQPAALRFWS